MEKLKKIKPYLFELSLALFVYTLLGLILELVWPGLIVEFIDLKIIFILFLLTFFVYLISVE